MIDNENNIPFEWNSIKINPNLMGEVFKATQRPFIAYIYCKYESSDDFNLVLNYRRSNVDSEVSTLTYVVDKDENFFKQKLPPNMTVSEFWFEINGSSSRSFECESIGVLWNLVNVGMG